MNFGKLHCPTYQVAGSSFTSSDSASWNNIWCDRVRRVGYLGAQKISPCADAFFFHRDLAVDLRWYFHLRETLNATDVAIFLQSFLKGHLVACHVVLLNISQLATAIVTPVVSVGLRLGMRDDGQVLVLMHVWSHFELIRLLMLLLLLLENVTVDVVSIIET